MAGFDDTCAGRRVSGFAPMGRLRAYALRFAFVRSSGASAPPFASTRPAHKSQNQTPGLRHTAGYLIDGLWGGWCAWPFFVWVLAVGRSCRAAIRARLRSAPSWHWGTLDGFPGNGVLAFVLAVCCIDVLFDDVLDSYVLLGRPNRAFPYRHRGASVAPGALDAPMGQKWLTDFISGPTLSH